MLRARLFGPLSLEIDGRAVPEPLGLRPRSVLAWLLLHPGRHARATLAARFWPDVLDTSARASLRSALWAVRAALDAAGAADLIDSDRDSVGITEGVSRDVDTEAFGRLAASGDPADLERALALSRAPLLADLADDWVLEARDDYAERAGHVALRLAELAEGAGDQAAAAGWTRRALAHDRLSESVHRLLIGRLASAGEPAAALAAYERCRAILSSEFGTAPSAETRRLAAAVRAGASQEAPEPTPGRPGEPAVRFGGAPLVGRRNELAALSDAWRAAAQGSGGVALVTGGPGVGKTRLAEELAGAARSAGAVVVRGQAAGLSAAPPFAVWSEVLRTLVPEIPAPPQHVTWPAQLARICPAVELAWGHAAAVPASDPELERALLFESVVEALGWSARARPLLVVLEDLHQADDASLALTALAGARLSGDSLLLAVTLRGDPPRALGSLARRGVRVTEVRLGPLPSAEIGALVDGVAPALAPEARAAVVAAAAGNPLMAREAARVAAADRDPADGLAGWVREPRARLSEPARLLADLAAAAGRPLRLAELSQLLSDDALAEATSEAAGTGLVGVAGDGAVAFSHEIVREAWYAELPHSLRISLHRRLAAALDERPGRRVAEVARHLILARDERRAAEYLAAAAAEAKALGALREAAAFLTEALRLAPERAVPELWLRLAEVESWRGDRTAHDHAFERAAALLEAREDMVALAGAFATRGRLLRTTLCFPREALGAYERALELISLNEIEAPELRALALAGAAWAQAAAGDPARAAELIADVERLPEVSADRALAAEVEMDRATALTRAGRFEESEAPSLHAAELARSARRPDLAVLALNLAASAAASLGRFERTVELTERAEGAGSAGTTLEAEALTARAYALARLGRHEQAAAAVAEAKAVAGRSGDREQVSLAAFDAGSLALAAGRFDEAVAELREALSEDSARVPRALARVRLADGLLAAGEADAARAELERVPFEPVSAADGPEALVPRLERLEGLLAAARDESEAAHARLARAESGWRRMLGGGPSGDLFAASLVDLGRAPVAGLIEPGVELGRVLAERALLLARQGRRREARAAAEEAERLAADLRHAGYVAVLRQVRAQIEEVGVRGVN